MPCERLAIVTSSGGFATRRKSWPKNFMTTKPIRRRIKTWQAWQNTRSCSASLPANSKQDGQRPSRAVQARDHLLGQFPNQPGDRKFEGGKLPREDSSPPVLVI